MIQISELPKLINQDVTREELNQIRGGNPSAIGAGVGATAGAISGYATGGLRGAVSGAVAGAVGGALNPIGTIGGAGAALATGIGIGLIGGTVSNIIGRMQGDDTLSRQQDYDFLYNASRP